MKKYFTPEKVWQWIIPLLITMCSFLFIFLKFSIQLSEDDTAYRTYLSGYFTGTPNAHVLYEKYIFTGFLSLLYRILPGIDWYGISFFLIFALSVFLVVKRIFEIVPNKSAAVLGAIVYLTVYLTAFLKGMIEVNFSYVATAAGITAVFYAVTMREKDNKCNVCDAAVIICMLCLCYFVRDEVFGIVICFVGLAVAYDIFGKKSVKERLKGYFPYIIITVLLLGTFEMVEKASYHLQEWEEYTKFIDDKTVVYDYYGYPEYEEYTDIFQKYGLDQNSYELLKDGCYIVMDREEINQLFAELAQRQQDETKDQGIRAKVAKLNATIMRFYDYWFAGEYSFYNMLILIGALACIIYYELVCRDRRAVLYMIMGLAGYAVMWVYLIYRGRINPHATIPLQMAALLFTYGNLLKMIAKTWVMEKNLVKTFLFWGIILCCGYSFRYITIDAANFSTAQREEAEFADKVIAYANENPDIFYFCNSNRYANNRRVNLAEGENAYNMMYWCMVSPMGDEKMERYQVTTGLQALTEQKDVYCMIRGDEPDILGRVEGYLEMKNGSVETELVDTISDGKYTVYVYRFQK